MALSAACPDPSSTPTATKGLTYSFPHPQGFEAGESHGLPWKQSPDGCVLCHVDQPRIRMTDSCRDCHVLYPHPEGFDEPDEHGLLGKGGGVRCEACHGTGEDRPTGEEQSACRDCHRDYPHRVTWAEGHIHGPATRAPSLNSCARCHGADWQGQGSTDACASCHELYPHSELPPATEHVPWGLRWARRENHGQAALDEGNAACAGSCHGEDFAGGPGGVPCSDCHVPYPHGGDYRVAHRQDVHELGEDSCLKCHEEEERGFAADFTCAVTCHGGAP